MTKQALSMRQGQLFFCTTLIALFIFATLGQYLFSSIENSLAFNIFYKQDFIILFITITITFLNFVQYKENSDKILSN